MRLYGWMFVRSTLDENSVQNKDTKLHYYGQKRLFGSRNALRACTAIRYRLEGINKIR